MENTGKNDEMTPRRQITVELKRTRSKRSLRDPYAMLWFCIWKYLSIPGPNSSTSRSKIMRGLGTYLRITSEIIHAWLKWKRPTWTLRSHSERSSLLGFSVNFFGFQTKILNFKIDALDRDQALSSLSITNHAQNTASYRRIFFRPFQ